MTNRKPLRVGLAGIGFVGGALARLLTRMRADLAARTGRDVHVAAFSARSAGTRGLPIEGATYFATPKDLAEKAEIDVFVELVGGADGAAFEPGRLRLR